MDHEIPVFCVGLSHHSAPVGAAGGPVAERPRVARFPPAPPRRGGGAVHLQPLRDLRLPFLREFPGFHREVFPRRRRLPGHAQPGGPGRRRAPVPDRLRAGLHGARGVADHRAGCRGLRRLPGCAARRTFHDRPVPGRHPRRAPREAGDGDRPQRVEHQRCRGGACAGKHR